MWYWDYRYSAQYDFSSISQILILFPLSLSVMCFIIHNIAYSYMFMKVFISMTVFSWWFYLFYSFLSHTVLSFLMFSFFPFISFSYLHIYNHLPIVVIFYFKYLRVLIFLFSVLAGVPAMVFTCWLLFCRWGNHSQKSH